jgi:hypothetical protein
MPYSRDRFTWGPASQAIRSRLPHKYHLGPAARAPLQTNARIHFNDVKAKLSKSQPKFLCLVIANADIKVYESGLASYRFRVMRQCHETS